MGTNSRDSSRHISLTGHLEIPCTTPLRRDDSISFEHVFFHTRIRSSDMKPLTLSGTSPTRVIINWQQEERPMKG